VWGETGFPGEDDVDIEVAATIAGTLESCRLDELNDLCNRVDDDIDSVNAWFDSFIVWNFKS
jgi:hypothetical protein